MINRQALNYALIMQRIGPMVALHSEGIWGLMIAWVTVGHLGVTVGHFRATAGHLRVIKGPLRVRN